MTSSTETQTLGGNRLAPLAFKPLPLGRVLPQGWLLRQLQMQAAGLSGHLDEFWPDVAQSGWIGGNAEGWERGPYWLDGVTPLAYLLGDPSLLTKVRRWVDYILERQHADGWLGPIVTEKARQGYAYDPWPPYIVLKALTQHTDATGDQRVVPALQRFFRKLQTLLADKALRAWGRFRWADLVLTIHWLYEQTPEDWLLDLAQTVHDQGFDWRRHFEHFPYWDKVKQPEIDLTTHVVNNAMAIKTAGVWYRQSRLTADADGGSVALAALDRWHGQATGMFAGDEHLAGRSPSQGTELCAVVEEMFSLEVLVSVLGWPEFADRLEHIAYNALPATISPDMWTHQYDQQVNQVQCVVMEDKPWTSNGPRANLFGLEPNFGCCTANMHQGWPKFAASLWMQAANGDLAAIAYAPCQVSAKVGAAVVRLDVTTDYPFGEDVQVQVTVDQPTAFALQLRIPRWANGATVRVGDGEAAGCDRGGFHRLERTWQGTTTVTLHFPMVTRVERLDHGAVAVYCGPLLLALPLAEEWRRLSGEAPWGDFAILPKSPWAYALELAAGASLPVTRREVGAVPFSPSGAPLSCTVIGRPLPGWQLEHNAAAPPPESPVASTAPREELRLIPYGSTNLRIAVFPVLE